MLKLILSSAAIIGMSTGAAMAADFPLRGSPPAFAPAPVFTMNWTGSYMGVHAGIISGEDNWTFQNAALIPWAPAGGRAGFSQSSWLGGIQSGYLYQTGSFVLGAESSTSFTSLRRNIRSPFFPATDSFLSKQTSLGLVQLKAGMTSGAFLFYLQGGFAYGQQGITLTSTVPGIARENRAKIRTGWTAGAGAAYRVAPNWSVAAEYNYVDLGSKTYALTANAAPFHSLRSNMTDHIGKLTLNYHFGVQSEGSPVIAKY